MTPTRMPVRRAGSYDVRVGPPAASYASRPGLGGAMFGGVKRTILNLLPPSARGRLRSWRVRRLIRTYPERVAEHAFGAGRLKVILADPLAEGWYDRDWPDLPELAELRATRLRPGARVFDLGAHQGVVALMLAREVGPQGRVVAVEPNPHNAAMAERNRLLNGVTQVEVVRAAVSDRPGRLTFNAGLNGRLDDGTGDQGQIQVEAVTVDGLADRFGPPDVVFIDVEGAEAMALAGAAAALRSGGDFFVEVHVGCGLEMLGGSVAGILSYFPAGRFTLLGRAEGDAVFRPFVDNDPLWKDRFFLLARVNAAAGRTPVGTTPSV